MADNKNIPSRLTQMLSCKYPIIGAPMFLVSNEDMVVAISEAGGIGTFPALNHRPIDKYIEALKTIKSRTSHPVGVNIIVNQSNQRQKDDLKYALDHGVELFITSLGTPKAVIEDAHKNGAKVLCDVTNLKFARKVQDLGADGIIAVGTGAGGHAGPLSHFSLIPWLKENIEIPIVAAGGVANGATFAAAMALGADGVSVGTRFIACKEATVDPQYKEAVVNATPEDIVLTRRVSGTPASVILTDYVKKIGLDLPWPVKKLKEMPLTKKYMVPLIHLMGMKSLENSALKPTWKTVWSAGQTVGLINEVLSCQEIMEQMVAGYFDTVNKL